VWTLSSRSNYLGSTPCPTAVELDGRVEPSCSVEPPPGVAAALGVAVDEVAPAVAVEGVALAVTAVSGAAALVSVVAAASAPAVAAASAFLSALAVLPLCAFAGAVEVLLLIEESDPAEVVWARAGTDIRSAAVAPTAKRVLRISKSSTSVAGDNVDLAICWRRCLNIAAWTGTIDFVTKWFHANCGAVCCKMSGHSSKPALQSACCGSACLQRKSNGARYLKNGGRGIRLR
jgi:hypothetical protein